MVMRLHLFLFSQCCDFNKPDGYDAQHHKGNGQHYFCIDGCRPDVLEPLNNRSTLLKHLLSGRIEKINSFFPGP